MTIQTLLKHSYLIVNQPSCRGNILQLVLPFSQIVLKFRYKHEDINKYEVRFIYDTECGTGIGINRNPKFLYVVNESNECISMVKKYELNKTRGKLDGVSYDLITQRYWKRRACGRAI